MKLWKSSIIEIQKDTRHYIHVHVSAQDIPDGDVFIHAGDFTRCGRLSEVKDFNAWIEKVSKVGEIPEWIPKLIILSSSLFILKQVLR